MIAFKTLRQLHEWAGVERLLRIMMEDAYDSCWPSNVAFIITDIFRTLTENVEAGAKTLIHVTPEGAKHRAGDVSARLVSDAAIKKVCDFVNAKWVYDPARPKYTPVYVHDAGSGLHFHFQVHPNTARRI